MWSGICFTTAFAPFNGFFPPLLSLFIPFFVFCFLILMFGSFEKQKVAIASFFLCTVCVCCWLCSFFFAFRQIINDFGASIVSSEQFCKNIVDVASISHRKCFASMSTINLYLMNCVVYNNSLSFGFSPWDTHVSNVCTCRLSNAS